MQLVSAQSKLDPSESDEIAVFAEELLVVLTRFKLRLEVDHSLIARVTDEKSFALAPL